MKQIFLTGKNGSIIGNYALVDDSDFEWLNQWKWYADAIGNVVYASRCIRNGGKRIIRMHRLILGLSEPSILCDHVDHNGLNNQRENLRKCTKSQNAMNGSKRTGTTSKYMGVHWFTSGNKWRVCVGLKHIGYFNSEIDAARAYNHYAIIYFGQFARLNNV